MDQFDDFETLRLMHTVMVLHFVEGQRQAEVAERLNLSTSKVSRLIAQGRKMGMIKFSVESPFQRLMSLEEELKQSGSLATAVVTPTYPGNPDTTLKQVGIVAGNHLLADLRDGDIIAITGGRAVSAVVDNIKPERKINVTVVPLTGGVQGKFFTDVNSLATRLADALGGHAMVAHAPLFAESREQRDSLMKMGPIREVFDVSRRATVALVGIGSILSPGSSYYDLHPLAKNDREMLVSKGVVGEFMAQLIHQDGTPADYALNDRIVALAPSEIAHCKRIIGVAAGAFKVRPIHAVLDGHYVTALVTDEDTTKAVLQLRKESSS
jgi:DNA-binding transcriptional regulator LsrR (DeoR family)